MRDSYAQTVVAPYSVRARPGAHVATPLHWAEVEDPGLSPARFTLRNVGDRLSGTDDPWAGMFRHRYDVATARRRLAGLTAPDPPRRPAPLCLRARCASGPAHPLRVRATTPAFAPTWVMAPLPSLLPGWWRHYPPSGARGLVPRCGAPVWCPRCGAPVWCPRCGAPVWCPRCGAPGVVPRCGAPVWCPGVVPPVWCPRCGAPVWCPRCGAPGLVPRPGAPAWWIRPSLTAAPVSRHRCRGPLSRLRRTQPAPDATRIGPLPRVPCGPPSHTKPRAGWVSPRVDHATFAELPAGGPRLD